MPGMQPRPHAPGACRLDAVGAGGGGRAPTSGPHGAAFIGLAWEVGREAPSGCRGGRWAQATGSAGPRRLGSGPGYVGSVRQGGSGTL